MSLSCFLLSGYHAESSILKHEHAYTYQALFQVHYIPYFYESFWAQKVKFTYEKIRILMYVSINTWNMKYFDHILPYFIYCCLANFQRIMNWYRLVLWFGYLFLLNLRLHVLWLTVTWPVFDMCMLHIHAWKTTYTTCSIDTIIALFLLLVLWYVGFS